ncbi:prephenate dehydratase [Magnetococcales bacterium HHB-1]
MQNKKIVAFQGMRGAYSEQACRERLPAYDFLPCKTFEDVFQAVNDDRVDLGMVPVENSMAGVVSDCYDLLAIHHLFVIGEHYLKVRHALLAVPGAPQEKIRRVYSHPQALAQCQAYIRQRGWERQAVYDTAGAAEDLIRRGALDEVAIASALCAELYGLEILARDIQDSSRNTTRFLLISRHRSPPSPHENCKTSLLFEVRNIPAALYKCLGGFATNGINLTRLESRPVQGKHWTYNFYLDFQGHIDDKASQYALEELSFFTDSLKILGCYASSSKSVE